jgi:prolyl-tRNA editing enzyme YbaK/EbsC (Cys-tRNA(Pro) deacylase)
MKPAEHPTARRTQQLLAERGIATTVVEFEQPTRTSAEAAAAIGCTVAEIAKSIVFRGKASGQAILVVASGDNRVCERKVAELVGEKLGRADADFVRSATGYAIGGVAPWVMPSRHACCLMPTCSVSPPSGPPGERPTRYSA